MKMCFTLEYRGAVNGCAVLIMLTVVLEDLLVRSDYNLIITRAKIS